MKAAQQSAQPISSRTTSAGNLPSALLPESAIQPEAHQALLAIEQRRQAMTGVLDGMARPLPSVESTGRLLAEAVHDARNLLSALGLYCELLEEPGVLSDSCRHYGRELRLVAAATKRLMDKIAEIAAGSAPAGRNLRSAQIALPQSARLSSLAAAVVDNHTLLSALAGANITVELDTAAGNAPVALDAEELTRILVNLVRNAGEAMTGGGVIRIRTADGYISNPESAHRQLRTVILTVEDNGPGLPAALGESIFEAGVSTRLEISAPDQSRWPSTHRGLGLAIVRSLVENAGGTIRLQPAESTGACFRIELPVC